LRKNFPCGILPPREGPDRRSTTPLVQLRHSQQEQSRRTGRRRVSRLRQTEIDKAPRDGNDSHPGASSFSRGEIVQTALSPNPASPQLHPSPSAPPVSGIPPQARD